MRAAEPTPGDSSNSYLSLPRRVDRDGRVDVSGSGGGVKNTVTIDTTVTEAKACLRPRGTIRRLYCGQAEEILRISSAFGRRDA